MIRSSNCGHSFLIKIIRFSIENLLVLLRCGDYKQGSIIKSTKKMKIGAEESRTSTKIRFHTGERISN